MIDFLKYAEQINDELISIRRDIHEHPELGFEEKRTSNIIKEFLAKEKILYKSVAGTGVCAIIRGKQNTNNKTIALRADMDALPIQEKNKCIYKSKVAGKMHACGHDAHIAILLGTAKILNKYRNNLNGNVKLLFEPAEETLGGAKFMINEGVLENPKVSAIIGLHVTENLEIGCMKIKDGMVNAASNPFEIKIIGKGGHGANPSNTVDPIIIAANIIMSIQTIVSRELSLINPVVITVSSIHGGTASNVIPESVILKGIIRTISESDRNFVINRINTLVKTICIAFRADADVIIEEGYPSLYNNGEVTSFVRNIGQKMLGHNNVKTQEYPSMGVESFAYFAKESPSTFYFLGTGNKNKNTEQPAHSNLFDIDEDVILKGVIMQSTIAIEYLTRQ